METLKQLRPEDYKIGIDAAKIFYNNTISAERMQHFLADLHNYLVVAIIDERIVGFVFGYKLASWHNDSYEFLLYDIEVLNECRRSGIGTKLINKFKSIAKKEGCQELWLPTNKSNRPAVEFYERMGGKQKSDDDMLFFFNLQDDENFKES